MATTKGPLMSLDASGSVADTITFSKWKGRNYVRELVIPANPKTGLQTGVRATFKFITQVWASLSATIQGNWADLAKANAVTPLNEMIRDNQTRGRQDFGMKQDPTVAEGAVEAAPVGGAAAAQPKSLKLTWTDSVGADDWCTEIYMSTTAGFTPSPANLIAILPHGDQVFTVTGLETGTTYRFRIRGNEKGGTAGTLAAEFSGTPT